MMRKEKRPGTADRWRPRPPAAGDWIVIAFILAIVAMKLYFWLAGP